MSESLKNIKYFEEQSRIHRDAMRFGYDLMKDNNDLISKLEYQNKLYLKDYIDHMHDLCYCVPYSSDVLFKVWKNWENLDALDTEQADLIRIILKDLPTYFFNEKHLPNAKLVDIIPEGWDNYNYSFYYKIYGQNIAIRLPMYDKANEENYLRLQVAILYETMPDYWLGIASGIIISDVVKDFNEWLDNKEYEFNPTHTKIGYMEL